MEPFGIAVLWRGDREARRAATPQNSRYHRIFEELAALRIHAEPAIYDGVLAARQLGIAEIPVMVAAGWTEAQKGGARPRAGRKVTTIRHRIELVPTMLARAGDRHRLIARSSGVALRHFGHVTFAPSSQYSFVTILAGTLGFVVVSHFPE